MKLDSIAIADIHTDVLTRDRSHEDPDALQDLIRSIRDICLRQPIEVFGIEPDATFPLPYGLISGHRRVQACRALGHTHITALLCNPADMTEPMVAMIAENEMRAPISPWEKGRMICTLLGRPGYDSPDQAIATLYRSSTRQQRGRIRNYALVVDSFAHLFKTPERLSSLRMDRLAAALRAGGEDVLCQTLRQGYSAALGLDQQWEQIRPVLNAILSEEPETSTGSGSGPRGPRHSLTTHAGRFHMTREKSRGDWVIRFTEYKSSQHT